LEAFKFFSVGAVRLARGAAVRSLAEPGRVRRGAGRVATVVFDGLGGLVPDAAANRVLGWRADRVGDVGGRFDDDVLQCDLLIELVAPGEFGVGGEDAHNAVVVLVGPLPRVAGVAEDLGVALVGKFEAFGVVVGGALCGVSRVAGELAVGSTTGILKPLRAVGQVFGGPAGLLCPEDEVAVDPAKRERGGRRRRPEALLQFASGRL